MKCNLQLCVIATLFLALRLSPDLVDERLRLGEPLASVRLAPVCLKLRGCEVLFCRKFSHLRPSGSPLSIWLAGDIESNPGPRNWKYPCCVCSAPVKLLGSTQGSSVSLSTSTQTSNALTIPGAAVAASRKQCHSSMCLAHLQ